MVSNDIPLNLRAAEHKATKLLDSYGVAAPEHIRLRDIAFDLGATVIEGSLDKAAASLTIVKNIATIRVLASDSLPRQRFSIAHELGHIVLHHRQSVQRICTVSDMENWKDNSQETEANFFASEIVLPIQLVKPKCDVREVNFGPIREIASQFRTSLSATAIKFVRLCPEMCAVVCSSAGNISWAYYSDDWWPRLKRGSKLNPRTVAYDFFEGKKIPDEPIELDADDWIDVKNIDGIVEHSVPSHQYGLVLSILWIRP